MLAVELGCKMGSFQFSFPYLGKPLRAYYKLVAVWDRAEKRFPNAFGSIKETIYF